MKIQTSLFLTVLLIFICCIGAASAAVDISDDSLTIDDEAVVAEQVDDADLQSAESDDATLEVNNAENENLRATSVTVTNWSQLAGNASSSGDKTINLASGVTYTPTSQIVFGNNAKIVGTSTSYISGSYSGIPFYNSNSNYHITFQNVKFKDISCTMLMQMLTTGTTVLDGCTFTNVNASSSGHNSVIYNNYGTMNITDCTFTNCRAAFGVVTNHNAASTTNVILNVKNSKFQNNYGYTEPGAINNCGILTVYNSTFIGNHAVWWAGAIHTHSNAYTLINKSYFQDNTAGWNGGALFTYGTLEIYDSCFVDNNCSTNMGGGAIGAYNYNSIYDIFIENCTFKNNHNLNSNGRGGAISTLNGGYLNVYDSTFIANSATTGQAICAYNQHIENGTNDKPYLAVEGCTFENHTGTSDTVYVNGYVNAFNDNTFINSPQSNHFSGSGNTYNSINLPVLLMSKHSEILSSSFNDDILELTPADTIYVNISSTNPVTGRNARTTTGADWSKAYGTDQGLHWALIYINNNGKVIVAEGNYTYIPDYSQTILDKYTRGFTIEGFSNNVVFSFEQTYNLDAGSAEHYSDISDGNYAVNSIITHKNIIFDCDIKLGSKNFNFIDCTFNKCVEISRDYVSDDICNITFENCIFANPKSDIVVADKNNVVYNECTFPVTAVNTNITIFSNEKGIVIINLTDVEGNPVANADVNYTIGTTNATGTTLADGTITIPNLKGAISIIANYTGNDSYLASNNAANFIFKYDTNISSAVSGSDIVITLKDDENNALANTNVTYTINGAENTTATDANGTITLSGLKGVIAITAKYAGDDLHTESNTTADYTFKYDTTLNAPKVSATYNVAKKLVITLKDENGKAIEGQSIAVKVGTISKNLKTDKNGQVSVNVATLVPKSYTATINFAGDTLYNAKSTTAKVVVAKATPKLTAAKKTFKAKVKTKKVTATLKDNKGKVLKNIKVTLKVKGKTYTAKTNKKGVATFKVTKLTKKGTYKGTVKFAGNKYFKAASKTVKIVVKK